MPKSISPARDLRLDALRGMFLLIMAAVHVPTPLSHVFQEPFGYTSVAEGFIFLSAYVSGRVYGKILEQNDWQTMAGRVWKRTRLIYLLHLGLLMPLALLAWATDGSVLSLANHFHDFLLHPVASLMLMPLLLHQPPLFDILPLYVVLLGVTPWLLGWARRFGWQRLVLISAVGWLGAQFFAQVAGGFPARSPLCLGSFNLPAWQFLWLCGLALGETSRRGLVLSRWWNFRLGIIAATVVLAGLLSRHGFWPERWFNPALYLWMDKWTLGPLRLLNFAAWVALFVVWQPKLPAWLLQPTALLGRNSLAVFSLHLVLAVGATMAIEWFQFPVAAQILAGAAVMAALFPWAWWQQYQKRAAAISLPATFTPLAPARKLGLQPLAE